jgi:uncharacterized protein YjbI with pentapeptide repeats
MDSKTSIRHLWYTRRGSVVRGPFPQGLISRYLLIGRIALEDEVSSDQIRWLPVRDVPELVPEELKGDPNDPAVQERLRIARRREDERAAGDRRQQEANAAAERRRKDDRRAPEPTDLVQYRNIRANLVKERRAHQESHRLWIIFGAAIVLSAAVAAAFVFMPEPPSLKLQCDAPAGPQVNWSNCRFEGIILDNANLAGAQLGNANLTGAQLKAANLSGANLAYANLSNGDLRDIDVRRAKVVGTTLRNANLERANAQDADFGYSILQGANLRGANFRGADLTKADLTGATIDDAIFEGAHLGGAIWIDRTVCAAESIGTCNP